MNPHPGGSRQVDPAPGTFQSTARASKALVRTATADARAQQDPLHTESTNGTGDHDGLGLAQALEGEGGLWRSQTRGRPRPGAERYLG